MTALQPDRHRVGAPRRLAELLGLEGRWNLGWERRRPTFCRGHGSE